MPHQAEKFLKEQMETLEELIEDFSSNPSELLVQIIRMGLRVGLMNFLRLMFKKAKERQAKRKKQNKKKSRRHNKSKKKNKRKKSKRR